MRKRFSLSNLLTIALSFGVLLAPLNSMAQEQSNASNGATTNNQHIDNIKSQAEKDIEIILDHFRKQESEKVYELSMKFVKQYESYNDPEIQLLVAGAISRAAIAQNQMGNPKKAIDLYNQLEKRYGKTTNTSIHYWLAEANIDKALIFNDEDDLKKTIALLKKTQRLYENSTDRDTVVAVARAMYLEGTFYLELNKNRDARKCFQNVIKKYENRNDHPSFAETVANAKEDLAQMK